MSAGGAERPRSIRSALARSLLGWMAAALVFGGVGLYVFVRVVLTMEFDRTLSGRLDGLAAALRSDYEDYVEARAGGHAEAGHDDLEEVHAYFNRLHENECAQVEVLRAPTSEVAERFGGRVPVRSRLLGAAFLNTGAAERDEVDVRDLRLAVGTRLRMACEVVVPKPGTEGGDAPGFIVAVGASRDSIDRPLGALVIGLMSGGAILLAGVWLVVRRSLRVGLAPLDWLAAEVSALSPARLPERLGLSALPVEIDPVRIGLNELIARCRETIERERRFAGAAAHELRTPLAEMLAATEVRLKWPEGPEAGAATLREVRDSASRLARLVGTLLAVARGEAIGRPGTTVVVGAEVDRALAPRRAGADAKGLAMSTDIAAAIVVMADADALGVILANLLDNAIEYTPHGGRVSVTARAVDADVEIAVSNSPVGLAPEDIANIFEPFWRKDAARAGTEHAGLGLTVCHSMAVAMGGKLWASTEKPDGLVLTLRLPSPG